MRLTAVSVILAACGLVAAAELPAGQLQRNKLLQFVDARGAVVSIKTVADWKLRRASILAAMQEIMGPLPGPEKRCPLDVKIDEEVDCGTYVRRLLTYQSEPGGRVPEGLLRLAIGLEDVEDLWADLAQAIGVASTARTAASAARA